MVTSIQLGNFFSSGGKTVLGGVGGSGLDTEGLIKSLTEAKALPATKDAETQKTNDGITAALTEFQTKLAALKDASKYLSNPPGVANAADNVFAYTTANVVSSTSTSADNYLSIAASPGVSPQSLTISSITSIAHAKQQSTGNIAITDADTAFVTASSTPNRFTAGTIVINSKSITLATGDTLNQVAAKFNTVSADTGITASVVKASTGNYQLVFTATSTGTDADFNFTNPVLITDPPSTVVDPDVVFNGFTFNNLQEASNAEFTVNNILITRQSNSINDVVSGITFNLLQETPVSTTLTANITPDANIVKNGVVNFINAYNDLRVFAAKQLQLGADGQYVETAVLAKNATFRNTMTTITSTLTQVVSGIANGDPSRLSELGITFADSPATADSPLVQNILTLDEGKLSSAFASDPKAFSNVFGFNLTSSDPNLRVFSRTNGLTASDFTLSVSAATPPALPTVNATYIVGGSPVIVAMDVAAIKDNSTGTILGYTLKGKSGTALDGLQLIYSSTSAATITVKATQGLADKAFNISNSVLDKQNGALKSEFDAITSANTRLTDEITKINAEVETYRQQLLTRFAALEQAISKVNNLLRSLDADSQARYGAQS